MFEKTTPETGYTETGKPETALSGSAHDSAAFVFADFMALAGFSGLSLPMSPAMLETLVDQVMETIAAPATSAMTSEIKRLVGQNGDEAATRNRVKDLVVQYQQQQNQNMIGQMGDNMLSPAKKPVAEKPVVAKFSQPVSRTMDATPVVTPVNDGQVQQYAETAPKNGPAEKAPVTLAARTEEKTDHGFAQEKTPVKTLTAEIIPVQAGQVKLVVEPFVEILPERMPAISVSVDPDTVATIYQPEEMPVAQNHVTIPAVVPPSAAPVAVKQNSLVTAVALPVTAQAVTNKQDIRDAVAGITLVASPAMQNTAHDVIASAPQRVQELHRAAHAVVAQTTLPVVARDSVEIASETAILSQNTVSIFAEAAPVPVAEPAQPSAVRVIAPAPAAVITPPPAAPVLPEKQPDNQNRMTVLVQDTRVIGPVLPAVQEEKPVVPVATVAADAVTVSPVLSGDYPVAVLPPVAVIAPVVGLEQENAADTVQQQDLRTIFRPVSEALPQQDVQMPDNAAAPAFDPVADMADNGQSMLVTADVFADGYNSVYNDWMAQLMPVYGAPEVPYNTVRPFAPRKLANAA